MAEDEPQSSLPAEMPNPSPPLANPPIPCSTLRSRYHTLRFRTLTSLSHRHAKTPYLRALPFPSVLIISALLLLNLLTWLLVLAILHSHGPLLATAALSYTLGLRHALDADHISAIDLMTRRLLASDPHSRPATVGTWFSLGHSTIVIITCVVVAATAAGVSDRFGSFGRVGGVVGSAVSAGFLIALGAMNAYILWKLVVQLRRVMAMPFGTENTAEALRIEGGGPLFRLLKRLFRLIDRPWKMYPLGVLFGLGFDTSSEIALLGISGIQGSKGTSIWLILVFPILFTVGMCLIDTIDGAAMLAVYVSPMRAAGMEGEKEKDEEGVELELKETEQTQCIGIAPETTLPPPPPSNLNTNRLQDPILFLYYSIILTSLTVLVALVIGTIQLLTLLLNVTHGTGPFWDSVQAAGDHYDVLGGAICASFLVVGGAAVLGYGSWRRTVDEKRRRRDELVAGTDAEVDRGDGAVGEVDLRGRLHDKRKEQATVTNIERGRSRNNEMSRDDTIEPV